MRKLSTIAPEALDRTRGGAARAKSSSTDWQLQGTLQSITDSLRDLKNQNNTGSFSKLLPVMVVAKVMRDRNG